MLFGKNPKSNRKERSENFMGDVWNSPCGFHIYARSSSEDALHSINIFPIDDDHIYATAFGTGRHEYKASESFFTLSYPQLVENAKYGFGKPLENDMAQKKQM